MASIKAHRLRWKATVRIPKALEAHHGGRKFLYRNLATSNRRAAQLEADAWEVALRLDWAAQLGTPAPDRSALRTMYSSLLQRAEGGEFALHIDGEDDPVIAGIGHEIDRMADAIGERDLTDTEAAARERSAAALVVRWIMPSEDDEQRQTCEVNPDIESLKCAVFGDKAELAQVQMVGSGISEFTCITLPVLAAPELVNRPAPPPWAEYSTMIVRQIGPILGQARTCPGTAHPACCHAEPGRACFPNWREHEDPPWYALRINILLSLVNQRIAGTSPLAAGLAADNAFELGSLFTEARIKFRWDEHAKRGEKVVTGARRGGNEQRSARLGRLTTEQTVAAVNALLQVGTPRMAAYSIVAEQQGVTQQTIAKEFQRHQK